MKIFESLAEWSAFRRSLSFEKRLGFAPTMGNLHIGHLSLLKASNENNDYTATSLFVNPTQFNQPEDYLSYPRTLEQDLAHLETAGVDFCLLPKQEEIYCDNYCYQIQENQLCQIMEGPFRPGHFNGVLTVVLKLLNLVKPHRAYFGEKDFQQYQLIKAMAQAFFLEVEVVSCPTVREASGLAYSSRNNRLSASQKLLAERFAHIFLQKERSCAELQRELVDLGLRVDYLQEYANRRYVAVYIDNIRLIDNYAVGNCN